MLCLEQIGFKSLRSRGDLTEQQAWFLHPTCGYRRDVIWRKQGKEGSARTGQGGVGRGTRIADMSKQHTHWTGMWMPASTPSRRKGWAMVTRHLKNLSRWQSKKLGQGCVRKFRQILNVYSVHQPLFVICVWVIAVNNRNQ